MAQDIKSLDQLRDAVTASAGAVQGSTSEEARSLQAAVAREPQRDAQGRLVLQVLGDRPRQTARGVGPDVHAGQDDVPVLRPDPAEHLHQHVVPRWVGDQNFMPVIGHTKTLPQLLQDTRSLLADAWDD